MNMLNRYFKIQARGSNLEREFLGGITAFFSTACLIPAIPGIPAQSGMEYGPAITAVCLTAFLGCVLTGLVSNLPFVCIPG